MPQTKGTAAALENAWNFVLFHRAASFGGQRNWPLREAMLN
jgi:hypothetical protein